MLLAAVVVLAALVVGWAGNGSLTRLGDLPLRHRRLVVAGLLAQLAGALLGGPFYAVGLVLSVLLLAAFLARNRGIRGTGLVALGLGLNALVVTANGAMPVSVAASGRAGVSTGDILSGRDPRHEIAGSQTRLRALSNIVPVPLPLFPEVVSPGDVLVAAGLGQLVVVGMGAGLPGRAPRTPRHGAGRLPPRPVPSGPTRRRPRGPSAPRAASRG